MVHGLGPKATRLLMAESQLNALTSASHDVDVAGGIAAVLMAQHHSRPVIVAINHDVTREKKNDPKTGACPVFYNWRLGKKVGLETSDDAKAGAWIIEAVGKGYEVSRLVGFVWSAAYSLETERSRQRFRARPRPRIEDDDEIPF